MHSERDIPIGLIRVDTERMPIRRHLCLRTLDRLERQFRRDPASVSHILVWSDPDQPEGFLLVSGRHRMEAAHRAGATQIASVLIKRSEADAATIALVELVRPGRRGSAWDTAQAMRVLHERLGRPSVRILAERVGQGRTQVARYIRTAVELPEGDVREALHQAEIDADALQRLSLSHLYEIACSDDPRLDDRISRLIDVVRTRQASKSPASGVPKAIPTATEPFNPGQRFWVRMAALLVLSGLVGFFL